MTQIRAIGLAVPRRYWRLTSGLIHQARLRRRWPRPDHFARMTSAQVESYVRSIGFDRQVRDALAEYDGGRDRARVDSGLSTAKGVALER